ncbi:MAG: pyruvate:ferredoxin (flavodoxin) oxidoreductase [Rickettsiaceae bacterium 4572_127]|nr:MAG: pyruvate:ferredoxin (flavodoxin) oxidoreductase [Rickettsiaceae bacterium 4572_127]
MSKELYVCDGNEACADVAYRYSDLSILYPITPSSPMGEHCDSWANAKRKNVFNTIPKIAMMQSEAGAVGALHGALQAGANVTTFTASQGLLLMIPNMYKIAGELHPCVIHVAARALATHALSIFGDHSDVMACRETGFAMLSSNSVQEAHDMAVISHCATLTTSIPFLHFFDGFRTSHEISTIEKVSDKVLENMIDEKSLKAKQDRAMMPENPSIRGTAQNPDVFFQAREAINPYYDKIESAVEKSMDEFYKHTGRRYSPVEYFGSDDATRVVVLIGSGVETVKEVVADLNTKDEKVGVIAVRLYRPFPVDSFVAKLPAGLKKLAVLDRTKEPGAVGEPLYLDVISSLAQHGKIIPTIRGRYGLGSKEFAPADVKALFDEMQKANGKKEITLGITDDVSNLSLKPAKYNLPDDGFNSVFWGLGSDGTVGGSKNTAKILKEVSGKYTQNYAIYDSKKSGSFTASHLRADENPINKPYLITDASFVSCSHLPLMTVQNITKPCKKNGTLLLNTKLSHDELWKNLPLYVRVDIQEKNLSVYTINASHIARDTGMGRRINTIMQMAFFNLTEVIPVETARKTLKDMATKSYLKKGQEIVDRNHKAIDATIEKIEKFTPPAELGEELESNDAIFADAPDFVKYTTREIIEGRGDSLPVSAFPVDGTFPTGTTTYEKRCIAEEVPEWDPEKCIQCGKCSFVCPHAAIRTQVADTDELANAPDGFKSMDYKGKELGENKKYVVQTSPADCTGCTLCETVCPTKALAMKPMETMKHEQKYFDYSKTIKEVDVSKLNTNMPKHTQLKKPLFEFSGACAGCGETGYVKLITQLFGDRMVIANATGCSSIYGGNLPTTPYTKNAEGVGVAWSNSLFEDNAEYGYGMKLTYDKKEQIAFELLESLRSDLPADLIKAIAGNPQAKDEDFIDQRQNISVLQQKLSAMSENKNATALLPLTNYLVKKSMWIVGGDGWAYDIGYGGLDHVIHMKENVNILVMDTEAYSNTGGQMSKATPMGASAKFASGGKDNHKKDLGLIAMASANVYIAKIAMNANEAQAVRAFKEAESFDGPSLILAYSPCIAHGVDLRNQVQQQKDAVKSGHWPLYRFDPRKIGTDESALQIDSAPNSDLLGDYFDTELRYKAVKKQTPELFAKLVKHAKGQISYKTDLFKKLSDK